MEWLRDLLIRPSLLVFWVVITGVAMVMVIRDLRYRNQQIGGLMRWVWILTVAYSGPFGLFVYYYCGRRQIRRDSLWRRAGRSVAHCYSGCGAGEVAGVVIAAGLLSLNNWWIAGISFLLAYAAGFAFTAGPLIQEGVAPGTAIKDAFYSETASITVMEVVAIGVDLWLAGGATMNEPLFWSSLVVSLTAGLACAYPVNAVLIAWGVKEGMQSPKEMGSTSGRAQCRE